MRAVPVLDDAAFRAFVDEYRVRCLWFLRQDYFPATAAECETVLRLIEQHGDRRAFVRAAEYRRWLSRPSSEPSVGY
jgi:hypothetical protein